MACICSFTFYFGDPYKRAEDMFLSHHQPWEEREYGVKNTGFLLERINTLLQIVRKFTRLYTGSVWCQRSSPSDYRYLHGSLDIILQQTLLYRCTNWWSAPIASCGGRGNGSGGNASYFLVWKIPVSQTQFAHLFSAITFNTKSIILAIDSHLISEYYFNFEKFHSTL